MPWASVEVNTPMLDLRSHKNSAAGSFARRAGSQHDHAHVGADPEDADVISILGICSHMMLKDKVECQDKLTRALSKAAARLTQVCSGRPSMQVPPDRNGWFQPWGILHEPLLLCTGQPKAQRSPAQVPPGLQKFCACKTNAPSCKS